MDHSGLNASNSSRTASRMRRLIRLRTTALPSPLGVVKPTRGPVGTAVDSAKPVSGKLKAAKSGHV
jgi:hypothetical protein